MRAAIEIVRGSTRPLADVRAMTWSGGRRRFYRQGIWAVAPHRRSPALRASISIPAGIHRKPLPTFLTYEVAGSAGWMVLQGEFGGVLELNFEHVGRHLRPATSVVRVAVVVLSLWWCLRYEGYHGTRPR